MARRAGGACHRARSLRARFTFSAPRPMPSTGTACSSTCRWIQKAAELEDHGRGLAKDDLGSRAFRPASLEWVGRLGGVDAVAGGDYVVVAAGVQLAAPGKARCCGFEAAMGAFLSDELDVVGEVGAEEGVLAGGCRGSWGGRNGSGATAERIAGPVWLRYSDR